MIKKYNFYFFILAVPLLAVDSKLIEMEKWSFSEKIAQIDSIEFDKEDTDRLLALKVLHRHLSQYYSRPWELNNSELNDVNNQMEPIREKILTLSKSDNENERFFSANFLGYLNIDEQAENSLFYLINIDSNNQNARIALDSIFGYNLDTPELRNKLAEELAIKDRKDLANTEFWGVARVHAGTWKLSEAVPYLIDSLKRKYEEDGVIDRTAAKQLKELGSLAEDALPILNELFEKRKADGNADFREIEALEYAISEINMGIIASNDQFNASDQINKEILEINKPITIIEDPKSLDEKVSEPEIRNWVLYGLGIFVFFAIVIFIIRKCKN